jgi:hypothetical protein
VGAGGLNVLQRFGGSLNFDPHTHLAAIDGVYSFDGTTGAPAFHFIDPPIKQEWVFPSGVVVPTHGQYARAKP